jgi:polysaccharide deacetylase family protein (PEP-CTERM system associated)
MRDARIVNALTVDVEDYFQVSAFERTVSRDRWDSYGSRVVANTSRLLDLFAESGVRATFFVLGWVAERHADLVRRIAATGHEVASHGYAHRLVYEMTPEEFREDLRRARRVLEDAVGAPILGFRAPSYSITARSSWALDILIEEGYEYDTSIFPIHHDRYGIPSAPRHPNTVARPAGTILEIPASTIRLGTVNVPIAGGGYFRLMPYWWTRWACRRVNRHERRPIVFYLHPWEVDPAQPRLPAAWVSRFRHYQHLEKTAPRLRRLLADFRFDAIGAAIVRSLSAAAPAEVPDARAAATLAQRG